MKISHTNSSIVRWRDPVGSRAAGTSSEKYIGRVHESVGTGRIVRDEQAQQRVMRDSLSTNTTLVGSTKNASTYQKIEFKQSSGMQPPDLQSTQVMPKRRMSDFQQQGAGQEKIKDSGFAGAVNSRLYQTAINTYRSHQYLEKRDQFIASVGIREIA